MEKIGTLLIDAGLIKSGDLEKSLQIQSQTGGLLGSILIRTGAISEEQLLPVLSKQLDLDIINTEDLPFSTLEAMEWLGNNVEYRLEWWADNKVFAWEQNDKICAVSRNMFDPLLIELLSQAFVERQIQWCLCPSYVLESLFSQIDKVIDENSDALFSRNLRELAEEAPVVEFVNNLLAQAVESGASDIHVEPQENAFEVRFRVDGVLITKYTQPRDKYDAIGSRIKLIANIDIAESRLPQDGRIKTRAAGQEFDIRVSTVPGSHGESVVMRLLPTEKSNIGFDNLGFDSFQEEIFKEWLSHPHGIVLVTGPTGSGKSTSLYTGLEHINDGRKKIVTVEDPVEYQIEGLTQVQALPEIGLTFASALRAFLRQDPDVIMVGEIRDLETAEIAIQSSLTGHLVLSTLHTNDSIGAFTRLVDMGVDRFLVATPIRAVMAQRLLRRLCSHCAVEDKHVLPGVEEIVRTADSGLAMNWKKAGQGCSNCNNTGYKGRIGIYEMVSVNSELQEAIVASKNSTELWTVAKSAGARTLREDGMLKAARGITSIDEVLRVTGE